MIEEREKRKGGRVRKECGLNKEMERGGKGEGAVKESDLPVSTDLESGERRR